MKMHWCSVVLIPLLSACSTTGTLHSAQPSIAESGIPGADGYDPHMRAAPPAASPIASPVIVPLDAAFLAALAREPVTATAHAQTLQCDGIPLIAVLRASGAMPVEPLRGAQLARYVQVDARDGYRVVYALSELDPTLGNRKVLLVDRCDGKPLADDDGPLRLIAPDEARPARWVRQVKAITVIVAP